MSWVLVSRPRWAMRHEGAADPSPFFAILDGHGYTAWSFDTEAATSFDSEEAAERVLIAEKLAGNPQFDIVTVEQL